MTDHSVFPDATYKDTVLAPLFDGVKTHYATHMMAINQAHLVMLADTSVMSPADAHAIAAALVAIEAETDIASLTYTGEHEDYFFYVESELRQRLGDLSGALHTARSRNDMDHTLFKMALRTRAEAMLGQIADLTDALIAKARDESETLIVAYTHGQPAQPTTFGHYLGAMIEVLNRDAQRLSDAIENLGHCPMGAAAITTSGFPIDRAQMATLLGFDSPMVNSYGCIASVDYITGLYSAVKLVFLHLGRVVQDLAFWSSFEVGQLYVPNALVQISSIMPQKRNPVPIEHMRHLASITCGRCDMVVNTMHNTPFTDMNDSEGEVQQSGYAAFDSGGRVLDLMRAFLPACSINGAKARRNMDAASITITELADTLVRDEALTFRQAHEIAANLARGLSGAPLSDGFAAFQSVFHDATDRPTALDETAFRNVVSPETFVARRDRIGGPAPAALAAALTGYATQLGALRAPSNTRIKRIVTADAARIAAFTKLLET